MFAFCLYIESVLIYLESGLFCRVDSFKWQVQQRSLLWLPNHIFKAIALQVHWKIFKSGALLISRLKVGTDISVKKFILYRWSHDVCVYNFVTDTKTRSYRTYGWTWRRCIFPIICKKNVIGNSSIQRIEPRLLGGKPVHTPLSQPVHTHSVNEDVTWVGVWMGHFENYR